MLEAHPLPNMTAATTPRLPSVQTTFNTVSQDKPASHEQFESQTDSQPTSKNASLTSSPESRPVDLRSPIPEEEEDETSSEAANEPVTPTDTQHPHDFHKTNGSMNLDGAHTLGSIHNQPLLLNTSATPPGTSTTREVGTPVIDQDPPKTLLQRRPTSSSKDSGIKRAVSGFFRRSNSHSANLHPLTTTDQEALTNGNGSDPILSREHRRMSIRRMSATTSSNTTRSNTPPSPGTPVDNGQPQTQTQLQGPSAEEFFNNKKNRSSTGFSFRDKIHKHKISFATHEKEPKHSHHRHRATSVDLHDGPQNQDQSTQNHQLMDIKRQVWGMPAEAGIGLKSRRMSLSLPDDFNVDVVELYTEYTDQSRMVGRRGKSVGKGATANVRLMNRKGGCAGEVYAVKEFRGKSSNEKSEDYEKKVKSEFSIAKSLHHPNIVETFRLCAHQGRWNHVMEFCDQGDLFKLVDQKYLYQEQHLSDRLCLFKQLIQGVHYLHSNGIAHRDIKLENLLITKESKLKITDFGVSEVFSGIHPGLRAAGGQCGKEMGEVRLCAPGICGSEPYIAPEVLQKQGDYDPRPLDVWSAAICMLYMTANGCLWEKAEVGAPRGVCYDDLVKGWQKWNAKHADGTGPCITETDYPHVGFFDTCVKPPALRRVLLTMLNPDPSKRTTIFDVTKNRWLKNVECCQVDSYDDPSTIIDASRSRVCSKPISKVVVHNHLPPPTHVGHKLVRLPGPTDMW